MPPGAVAPHPRRATGSPVPLRKEHPTMKTGRHPDRPGDARLGRGLRPLLGALLLLLLGWGSAAPASATIEVSAALGNSPYTLNTAVTDNIVVDADGELDVVTNGS